MIELRGVTKTYRIRQRATPRLGAWVLDKMFEHLRSEPFQALNGLDLSVKRGELLGIVGSNGAGKSTLLKIIAGITKPTAGTVRVHGRVASLLELGVGFHPDLSGMENIFYAGALLGLSRAQILERLGAIIDFSGLAQHIDNPVRHYSTGMYSRLALSVALHVDPDIVLVDEILGVGDAEFQHRGMLKLLDLHERGTTLLIVTHELTTARYLCERFVWIEEGRVVADGPAKDVYAQYMGAIASRTLREGHPFRDSGAALPELLLVVEGAPGGAVRSGAAVSVRIPAKTAARAFVHCKWWDGRTLFEDEAALPHGLETAEYRIDAWPFGEFRGHIAMALLSESGAVLARSPYVELNSVAPGVAQPEFVLLPHADSTVRRVP